MPGHRTEDQEAPRSPIRFLIVTVVVFGVLLGTAYAIFRGLYANQTENYQGPSKIVIPEHAPFR